MSDCHQQRGGGRRSGPCGGACLRRVRIAVNTRHVERRRRSCMVRLAGRPAGVSADVVLRPQRPALTAGGDERRPVCRATQCPVRRFHVINHLLLAAEPHHQGGGCCDRQQPVPSARMQHISPLLKIKNLPHNDIYIIYLFQFTQYSVAGDRLRQTEGQKKNHRNTIKTYIRKLNTC